MKTRSEEKRSEAKRREKGRGGERSRLRQSPGVPDI